MKKAITILVISLLSCINTMAVQSGKCGDNATWILSDDSVLTISGTGEIKKFDIDIDKNKVKEAIIKDGISIIGEKFFAEFKELTKVTLPNTLTEIGDFSFATCLELTDIEIPNKVTRIGNAAFLACFDLISVVIPNSVTEIGIDAFFCCGNLEKITIPNSVSKIQRRTFFYCSSLRCITISNSVTEIEYDAFRYCSSLIHINIPKSVKKIEDGAFYGCSNLKKIICESITPPDLTFANKTNKPTLYVPKESIKAYKKADGWRNFKNIKAIESLNKK